MTIPGDQAVALTLMAYDQDVQHDWRNRPKWIDSVGEKAAGEVTTAAVAALVTNPVGWGVLASRESEVLSRAGSSGLPPRTPTISSGR